MAHKSGKLACIVNAAKLDAAPLDRLFLAAILRSVCDGMVSRDSIQDEVNKAAATAADAARAETKYEVDRAKEKVKEANQWLEQLREKTGIDLDKWDLGPQAKAIKALQEIVKYRIHKNQFGDGLFGTVNRTRLLLGHLETLAKELSGVLEIAPCEGE